MSAKIKAILGVRPIVRRDKTLPGNLRRGALPMPTPFNIILYHSYTPYLFSFFFGALVLWFLFFVSNTSVNSKRKIFVFYFKIFLFLFI